MRKQTHNSVENSMGLVKLLSIEHFRYDTVTFQC